MDRVLACILNQFATENTLISATLQVSQSPKQRLQPSDPTPSIKTHPLSATRAAMRRRYNLQKAHEINQMHLWAPAKSFKNHPLRGLEPLYIYVKPPPVNLKIRVEKGGFIIENKLSTALTGVRVVTYLYFESASSRSSRFGNRGRENWYGL